MVTPLQSKILKNFERTPEMASLVAASEPETNSAPTSPTAASAKPTTDTRCENHDSGNKMLTKSAMSKATTTTAAPGVAATKEQSTTVAEIKSNTAPTHPAAWNAVYMATTEAQLVSALSSLLTNLNRAGDRLGLTKKTVLKCGKAKKDTLTPQVWTKNVARMFGAVLKRSNVRVVLSWFFSPSSGDPAWLLLFRLSHPTFFF